MIPASQCKAFHSPPMPGNFARETYPSVNIGERGQNLNLVPCHLEGRRSDFHPDWLCPTMLYFTGYAKTYFSLLPVAAQHFMPCAVTPLPCARIPPVRSPGAGDWTPEESCMQKSPDRMCGNPCYSPALQPLLRYRIGSWDSAKPHAVSQKHV